MSLLVWLPLNGNLNNQGVSSAKFSLVNGSAGLAAATTGGKVQPGLYQRTKANTADYITSDINFTLKGDVSMCCWCKITGYGTNNSANGIITQHGHNTGGIGITMKYIGASDYRMSINSGLYGDAGGSTNDRTYMTHYGNTNIYNAWHHLCVTYDATTKQARLYVDGNLDRDVVQLAGNNTTARPFRIFDWSTDHSNSASYRPPCQLNDVRLYDHCLSQKEVKEIAYGLIAHYPLRDKYFENTSNILSYPTPGNSAASTGWDATLHSKAIYVSNFSSGYNGGVPNSTQGFHAHWQLIDNIPTIVFPNLNSQINQKNRWLGISYDGLQSKFTTGKTYTISMDVKGSVPGMTIGTGLYYNNNSSTNFHDGCIYKTIPTDWTRFSWTYTTGSVFNTGSNAAIYIYGHSGAEGTAYVRNIQLEFNDHVTSYQSNQNNYLFNNTIKDCSGNNYDLSLVGTQIYSAEDSIRNTSCIAIPDGQASYLKNDSVFFPTEKVTMSCWFKNNSGVAGYNNYHIPFSSVSGHFEISVEGGGKLRNGFYVNGTRQCITTSSKNVSDGNWHMLTTTFDGTQIKRYVDGEMVPNSITAVSGTLSGGNKLLTIGHYGTDTNYGNKQSWMSDVRLYATALSDADILDLYKASISIDDQESIHAYEFIEVDLNNFKKNGTVNFGSISNAQQTHDMKMKTLSDGSTWVRIFWHDVSFEKSWFDRNAGEHYRCLNKNNRFSRMDIVDKFKTSSGVYEFMLTYPSLSSTLYNRWTQTSSPDAATVTGYIPVTIAWSAHSAGIRKNGTSSYWNCDSGSTWYAPIGQSSTWTTTQYIPAADGSSQTSTELWVRIDNLTSWQDQCSIFDGMILSPNFIEI